MCFTCSSLSCCASFDKTASRSKMNGSGESLSLALDGREEKNGVWRRTPAARIVLKQLRSSKEARPSPPTPTRRRQAPAQPDEDVRKKIESLLDENLYEDAKNANLVAEEGRRAPSGTPRDLLEQWVIGLRMDRAKNDPDDDSTSFSDASTQTEWSTPRQGDDEREIRRSEKRLSERLGSEATSHRQPRTTLTTEEETILESRLNWLGSRIEARRPGQFPDRLGDRRSVTMPNWTRTGSERSTVRSLTGRGADDAALAEFRRELANSTVDAGRREARRTAERNETNDLDAAVSDTTTSDNNKIVPVPALGNSSKRSSGTCSCSNSSCGCSCCSDAWWLNESEVGEREAVFKGALTPVQEKEAGGRVDTPWGKRPEPEGEETKMDDSSSSGSSGYEEWRDRGARKERATTLTSTTTSSSNNWTPPESDEWVFVVSTSISSNAPEREIIRLAPTIEEKSNAPIVSEAKKGDSLGYGTLPPSDSDLILAAKTGTLEGTKKDTPKDDDRGQEGKTPMTPEEKKRGIAYFRKKMTRARRDKNKDSVLDKRNDVAVVTGDSRPGAGKVAAEVARINANRRPPPENLARSRIGNENGLRITSALIRERTSSLGRSFGRRPPYGKYEPRILPDRAVLTSPEVTPTKRSARKQRLLRERAMQIEVERCQMTTDEEDEDGSALEDPDWMSRAGVRAGRRRRSGAFGGERRRGGASAFVAQNPGIGQLLMVQAEYGQNSVLGRDNVHITAV